MPTYQSFLFCDYCFIQLAQGLENHGKVLSSLPDFVNKNLLGHSHVYLSVAASSLQYRIE